jgi:endonuclease G, mitochondrial
MKLTITLILTSLNLALAHAGNELKLVVLDPSYDHDKFVTQPTDIVQKFRAFTVSFDSHDDDDNSGKEETWRVPEWVAYEIKKFPGDCIPTSERPRPWIHDEDLFEQNITPKDESYKTTMEFKKHNPDFDRGHLCMKLIAERLGHDAAWNTHVTVNAVPQWGKFNRGIWLDLEYLTAAWAQRYGQVWVITGPVFLEDTASNFIGDPGELPVAIPEALFKIVVKENDTDTPDVLAFLYPQIGPGYVSKEYDHTKFLTSVDEIEAMTGLDFLTALPDNIEKELEKMVADKIWGFEEADFIRACDNR